VLKNPLSISYQDLIDQAEARLKWMEGKYPALKESKQISDWTATHNIECQRTLVKLLKKFKREPQMNLFAAFEKMK